MYKKVIDVGERAREEGGVFVV